MTLFAAVSVLSGLFGCIGLAGAGTPAQKSGSSSAAATLAITSQPAGVTVASGQTATFSVIATGTGTLTYQWKKGGTAINGATGSSYKTPATKVADSGAQFTVIVTDATQSLSSSPATLTVSPVPVSELNASQASLNFSSVDIGSKSVLPVVFSNGGNAQITISNVTVSGAGYSASGIPAGQILAPGSEATLNVTFAPAGTGTLPGSVTITSDASDSSVPVALAGTGVQQQVSHSATLAWSENATNVTGYNAYRSTVSGGPYTRLNAAPVSPKTYADAAVQGSQIYYYVVTAVDSAGLESAYSAEVSATIP